MRMLALGVDHRSAPTAVREALAFEGGRLRRGLDALKADAPGAEFVLLSTCNRVELYAAAEADPPDGEALAASLARAHGVPVAMLEGHLVARRDGAAVDHLFRVAASLERRPAAPRPGPAVAPGGQVSGAGNDQTLAVACAFLTDAAPGASGPLPGLISKSGIQRAALTALDLLSSQRLDGHVVLPEALLLERLRWTSTAQPQPVV